jgi:hypothetical protein
MVDALVFRNLTEDASGDFDRGGGKMEECEKKHGLSPLKPVSDAGFEGCGDPMLCTQRVWGSNPLVSTRKFRI